MHVRRVLIALVAVAAGTVLASPAAHATPYVPGVTVPTISAPSTVQAGVPFTITGSGFAANEWVTVTINVAVTGASFEGSAPRMIQAAYAQPAFAPQPALAPQSVRTQADPQGNISVTVTVRQTGALSITAVGDDSQAPVEAPVTVIPALPAVATSAPEATGGLVQTGSNVALPALLGFAIVGAGALLVWLAVPRRRRREDQGAADAG